MIDLYIARHGQTEENVARIFQGHLPGRLTEEGKRQAMDLGVRMKDVELDAVLSSDLKRVTDTVQLAMEGRGIPWEKTPMLREIDWGSWTGLPLDSVDRSRIPSDAETKEMLYARAGKCLEYIRLHYQGKRLLVVAHGLINRSLRAWIEGVTVDNLTSIPRMDNCEVVHLKLE